MAIDAFALIPTIVAPLVSIVCCLWLLVRSLPRISQKYARKLLLRQMWHLALADILMSIGGVPLNVGQLWQWSSDRGPEICRFLQDVIYPALNGWGLFASVLFEMHIALGFTMGLFRWSRAFRCLERALPWVWPLSLALSVLDTLTSSVYFDEAAGVCRPQLATPIQVMRPVQVGVVILMSAANCVCYLALVCFSGLRAGPASVEVRVWRQCSSFTLVFMLTWGPWLFTGHFVEASWAFGSSGDEGGWAYISGTCLGLNGALNCITYAGMSRYVRQIRTRRAPPRQEQQPQVQPRAATGGESFHAKFANEDSIQTFLIESFDDHPVYFEEEDAARTSGISCQDREHVEQGAATVQLL